MSGADDHSRDDAALAAEYVLRLLPPSEAAAFEVRLLTSPALRAAVSEWEAQFAPLADEIEPVKVPARVEVLLMTRLFGESSSHGRRMAFPNRVGLWRALTLISASLVAFMAVEMYSTAPPPVTTAPLTLTEITAEDDSLRIVAAYDGASGQLQVARVRGAPLPGRVLELWAIAGTAAPVSLGVLPEAGPAGITLPEGLNPDGLVLAVSDEPPGGSPTGAPTGAVLAVGSL